MKFNLFSALSVALLLFCYTGCDPSVPLDEPGEAAEAVEPADDEEVETEQPGAAAKPTAEQEKPDDEEIAEPDPALLAPDEATEQAPDEYQIEFETTQGDFTVTIHRDWAPKGADRLYNLVRIGFFEDIAFFRVIDGFMAQFGLHGHPDVNAAWRNAEIEDDEVTRSNTRGKVTFATRGPDSRTTQLFINFGDNSNLDAMGFSPVGEVDDGMDVVDSLYSGYGEGAPRGRGPDQGRIQRQGNTYLRQHFENLDYVVRASIVEQ